MIQHSAVYQIRLPLLHPKSENTALTIHLSLSKGDDLEQVVGQLCAQEGLTGLVDMQMVCLTVRNLDRAKSE